MQNNVMIAMEASAVLSSHRCKALACKAARLLDPHPAPEDITLQYNIGKTENNAVHIPTFLARNTEDPAIIISSWANLPNKPLSVHRITH